MVFYGILHMWKLRAFYISNDKKFLASQGYTKASCKSFLGRVAIDVYKIINNCIGFLFYTDNPACVPSKKNCHDWKDNISWLNNVDNIVREIVNRISPHVPTWM